MVGSFQIMTPHTIQTLRTAIADSIANASVPTVSVPNIEATIAWIRSRFVDVDWDLFPDRVVIFGDDPSIPVSESGDGEEGHFVLTLTR
jgi:hypothetical protein